MIITFNCALDVYAVPRTEGDRPILEPQLSAIDVEKYEEIPGASMLFERSGSYQLVISGTAKDNASFAPFELSYEINVRPK